VIYISTHPEHYGAEATEEDARWIAYRVAALLHEQGHNVVARPVTTTEPEDPALAQLIDRFTDLATFERAARQEMEPA